MSKATAFALIAACLLAARWYVQHLVRQHRHWWHTNGPRIKATAALSVIPIILVGPLVVRHAALIVTVLLAQLIAYAVYFARQTLAGEAVVEGWRGLLEADRHAALGCQAKATACASWAKRSLVSRRPMAGSALESAHEDRQVPIGTGHPQSAQSA